ncbi:MAG: HD domain-containing protein [Deltaproteobacteria bacterium]|nr:HD domain-containing protein [Candidatus Zymogenaceae bacterium]
MTKTFVSDLTSGQPVDGIFLVREKAIATTRDGRPYLNVNLIDRTGKVGAKLWEKRDDPGCVQRIYASFQKNDFVRAVGRADLYKETMQLILDDIIKADTSTVDISDFLPSADIDPEKVARELKKTADTVIDPYIKKLLDAFFKDKKFMERFKRAPAAKKLHQAYLGGLIEHTALLVNMAVAVADFYPHVNRDLLIAGAFLHDIGKVEELEYNRVFDYTDRGRFMGHLVIGARMVSEKIDSVGNFPKETGDLILHLILSHHGELQYGSPVVPVIPEAVMLHHLDHMDATVWGFLGETERSSEVEGNWSKFSNVYQRYIFTGDRFFGHQDEGSSRSRKGTPGKQTGSLSLFDDEEEDE